MKKIYKIIFAAALIVSAAFQVSASNTPAADDGKWYYVKSQRWNTAATSPGPWWTFGTTTVIPGALTKTNNQKFTLVTAATGRVTIKAYGTNGTDGLKLSADGAGGTWNATGAATGWIITSNVVNSIQGYAFPGENSGIHQGSGGWGWRVATSWYNLTDNCTFFFYEATADAELRSAIDEATVKLNSVVVGTKMGQISQTNWSNYQNAITTAQATVGSTDDTAIQTAISNLATAATAFTNSIIQATRFTINGNYVIKVIDGSVNNNRFLVHDGTNASNYVPTTADLTKASIWSMNFSDKGYASPVNGIVTNLNVKDTTSRFLDFQAYCKNVTPFVSANSNSFVIWMDGSTFQPDSKFAIQSNGKFFFPYTTAGTYKIGFSTSTVLNSSRFLFSITDFNTAVKAALNTAINTANTLKTNTPEGTGFGQYTAGSRSTLSGAIILAQSVYENATATDTQIITATSDLNAAVDTYKASINKNPVSLLSTNPENYRWYSIRSYATNSNATYCFGKVISTGTRAVGEKYTFEAKAVPASEGQLFRFELTGDQTKVLNIIDKKGNYMAANGAIATASTAENEFALTLLEDVKAFWIKPTSLAPIHAQQTGTHIVNWSSGVGSASAWVFDFEQEAPIIPRVPEKRTVAVQTSNAVQGTAVITGTTDTSVFTDYESVSVSANPSKGFFFKAWLNEAGDTISLDNPYVYTGVESITLVAHFEKGYYRTMMRQYTSATPYLQQAERFLASATASVGGEDQNIIFETVDNPNPLDPTVTTNQIVGNALVDVTGKPIVVHGSNDFYFTLVGANIGLNDGLEWTQQNVFIDWNNDYDFLDANEVQGVISDNTVKTGITRSISLPLGQKAGMYRMRIIYHEPADAADWATTIWNTNILRNGVGYDFDIFYDPQEGRVPAKPLVSTTEKPVYYLIESASNGLVNLNATTPGKNYLGHLAYAPTGNNNTIIKHDLITTITTAEININNALWQMVNEDGIVKLKNKGTGLYLDESRWGRAVVTSPFSAVALNSPATQYALKNANQASPAVAWNSAANGNYLDRWGVFYPNSQVAWFFVVAPGSQANYEEVYPAAVKNELAAKIASLQTFYDNTKEGQEPGTFTDAARNGLAGAISSAQTVHDSPASTVESYQKAMVVLETAKSTYLALVNKPVVSEGATTKWYLIRGTRPANTYMSSTGTGAAVKSLALVPDDAQLWKFVTNTNGTADGLALVNKATGEYLNADAANNTVLSSVAVMPVKNIRNIASDIYTDGIARFWIENTGSPVSIRIHAGNAGVMNWYGNAYDNSSWLILEYIPTAVNNVSADKYRIYTTNGIIKVEGVEDFEVYSVTGQKQYRHSPLKSGVYVVKIQDYSQKVIVK